MKLRPSDPVEHELEASVNLSNTILISPVFLVGSVRSGTTLLRLMLDHHPRDRLPLRIRIRRGQGWQEMANSRQQRISRLLATHRGFQLSGAKIDTTLDYAELVNSFLIQSGIVMRKPSSAQPCTIILTDCCTYGPTHDSFTCCVTAEMWADRSCRWVGLETCGVRRRDGFGQNENGKR